MTNTASLCEKLGGLKNKSFSMTNMHWKTIPILQQEWKELETRKNWVLKLNKEGAL